MKFKNVSPMGDLEFPLLGRVVAAGEIVDIRVDQVHLIEGQTSVWEPVSEEKK